MAAPQALLPVYWHPDIALHDQAAEHVAMHPLRLSLVAERLLRQPWALEVRPSVGASRTALERAHCADYLDILQASQSLQEGRHFAFDSETRLNRHTWRALELSAGAWVQATEAAYLKGVPASFCVSYAGHHAWHAHAAGFCFINGAAVAAHHALALGAQRVAVVDIDTHAGDGAVLSVLDEPRVFFGETFQPGFPGGFLSRPTRDGILRIKTQSPVKFREYWERILARLQEFNPQLLLISAGFDAHEQDPLTRIGVPENTYAWLGQRFAQLGCSLVCGLEGGYNLDSTRRSVEAFCAQLVHLAE